MVQVLKKNGMLQEFDDFFVIATIPDMVTRI